MSNTQKALDIWNNDTDVKNNFSDEKFKTTKVSISKKDFGSEWMDKVFGKDGIGYLLANSALSRTVGYKNMDFKTLYNTLGVQFSIIRNTILKTKNEIMRKTKS